MNRYTAPLTIFLFTNGIAQTGVVTAAEIYKWVGSDGLTHYSETLPASELASVEVLDIATKSPSTVTSRKVQSMLDVARSLETSRLERERQRLEQRKISTQNAQPPGSNAATNTDYPSFFGYPYPYPYWHYAPYRHYPPVPRPYARHGHPPPGDGRGVNARAYLNPRR